MSGVTKNLFIKVQRGEPVKQVNSLSLIKGFGIEGDVNASKYNPRQILISSLEILDKHNIKPGDIKENIVVSGLEVDKLPSGSVVQIGQDVKIRITFNCEPCGFLETVRKGLAAQLHGQRGILGVVLNGGEILPDMEVKVLGETFEEIPFVVFDRFAWMLRKIPKGKIVSYTQVIEVLGLFSVYYRVIPTYIKKLLQTDIAFYKVVDSKGQLLDFLPDQQGMLEAEGIEIKDNKVDLDKYSWDSSNLYY